MTADPSRGDPSRLSALPKTWIIDLDGVVLRHNGHLHGAEEPLPGVVGFWEGIGADDLVIVVTARKEREREQTMALLAGLGLRVDHAVFGAPVGERILINDDKPSGLPMAHAVNIPRDRGLADTRFVIDNRL